MVENIANAGATSAVMRDTTDIQIDTIVITGTTEETHMCITNHIMVMDVTVGTDNFE